MVKVKCFLNFYVFDIYLWKAYTVPNQVIQVSKISNIPFTTQFSDSSILIKIISCDYIWICHWRMNTLVTPQYQPRLWSITKIFSRRISESDCSIQIKLNYLVAFSRTEQYQSLIKTILIIWYNLLCAFTL